MRIINWDLLNNVEREAALSRPVQLLDEDLRKGVADILNAVRTKGDQALRDYTKTFDGVDVDEIKVSCEAMKLAWVALPEADKKAMQIAKANIETFHKAQIPCEIEVETMPGVVCRRVPRPLDSAGLYVPGGSAPLVSTLIMLAVPAKLAGVEKRVVVTPPSKDGKIDANILAAAYLCGIEELYMVGGAQAIAALAYGTKTIPKCVKVFGPGNAYVAQAKALISTQIGGPSIDLPAGPSEAMVLADDKANIVFVAADLLSQAEHDPLAQVICVCRSQEFADALNTEITRQLADLPRKEIAEQSLANGRIITVSDTETMLEIANAYAPEHLIVQTGNPENMMSGINNAGSVFLGSWTPESVGDYASGTNHTLPTFGAARAYSGVCVESFMKFISIQSLTKVGLKLIGPTVERLAALEGLEAHKRAVNLRLGGGGVS